MSKEKRSRKRRSPKAFRERAIPRDRASRAELVRALTRDIAKVDAHTRAGVGWRDRRQLYGTLEKAINVRGEVLELLRVETPTAWQALCAELDLAYEPHLTRS